MTDEHERFGVLLRRYRTAAALTQEELAEQAQMSTRAITDLERGVRRFPQPGTVRRLADVLQLSAELQAGLMNASRNDAGAEPSRGVLAFGGLLRRHRAAAGLSQEALAQRAGLSRRGVADLERGARHFPYGDTVRRLAEALGLGPIERAALLAAGQRPEAGLSGRHTGLPLELSELIGRKRELSELQLVLRSVRLLTLTGSAGIGKTRLAVELARLLEPEFEHGAAFVDLAPVRDPDLVPRTIAVAVGVRERGHGEVLEALQEELGRRHLLMVLDNCEHVLLGSARVADALVRGCPELRVLATSREALRIRGETVWPVPSLRPEEGTALFVSRARAAQATLRFSDEETQVIRDVCRRLDSLPLAIELAAARVPALGLRQLGERLTERLRVLTSGSRLDAPRHQTLRAAIDWSYALLSDAERRLFEQLSVFAGGFEAEAIGPVCDGDVDVLAELVAKSLVVAEPRNGSVRYRLLETLREYAAERLEESGQAHAVRRRHVRHFRAVAEDGSRTRRGVRYARDMDVVNRDHDNLRAALSAVLASGELDEGLAICQALSGFWLSRGHLEEGTEWLRRFLERPERLTPDGLAQTLYTAGRIAEYRGALDVARHHFEVSLSVAQQHGREPHVARALFGLGDIGVHASDLDRACAAFEAGLPLARAAGLLPEIAEALVSLARIDALRGQQGRARQRGEEALAIQHQLGDAWGVAYVSNELGSQARHAGDLERAQVMLEQAYALWRESGSRMGERAARMNLAVVTLERGDPERARALARDVLELCTAMADASATSVRCLEIASDVLRALRAPEDAVCLAAAADTHRQALGAPVPVDERPEREATLLAARAALPAEAFEQAWQKGIRLSIQEAVVVATDRLTSVGKRKPA